ncbi:hypothetical protein HYH68_16450 [Clostridium botulinum]|uniref:hypothetical protein n=1 Tax=Clostridium botulinum TaxID=1491 RepID=UPI001C9ADF45|nr:hypothetical protein [Clostridium botulinum]MBY6889384.1 hypothetical protein [Clostridium botulinum]
MKVEGNGYFITFPSTFYVWKILFKYERFKNNVLTTSRQNGKIALSIKYFRGKENSKMAIKDVKRKCFYYKYI